MVGRALVWLPMNYPWLYHDFNRTLAGRRQGFSNLLIQKAGQGTGLGLSLAYDILQAHGGEKKVGTKEGEGCELIIQLPN